MIPPQATLRDQWTNYVHDQSANPLKLFRPDGLAELRFILHEAQEKGYKVKAIGSGHSSSDIAVTADYMIDTHGMDRVLDVGLLDLAAGAAAAAAGGATGGGIGAVPGPADLFFVECGITIKAVNQELEKRGKALINMGAYDGQTIAGVLSTSTHGSGMELGAFPACLKAILLLAEDGTLYHLERSPGKGISRGPVRLAGGDRGSGGDGGNAGSGYKGGGEDQRIRFIQDDDTFLTAGVSMGCLGIIYAVVIEVMGQYMLEENRYFSTWADVKEDLKRGDILRDNRHLEVLVSAYQYKGKGHKCLVTRRNIVHREYRSPLIPRGHRKILPELLVRLVPDILLDAGIRFLVNHFPWIIPWFVQTSLNTLTDRDYIDKTYKVLNLGADNNLAAYATEIALPSHSYLEAVEEIIRVVNQSVTEGMQYLTAPFSLRFVQTNDFFLSMQYARPGEKFVCMIEFPTVSGAIGGTQLLARVESALYNYGGIPHWGQVNHVGGVGRASVGALYPRFGDWMKVWRTLSPQGRFENQFTHRCGITHRADQEPAG